MRVIGDTHGKIAEYIPIAKGSPDGLSIQVGDMGFDYSLLSEVDPGKHRFIPGNHDHYWAIRNGDVPHALYPFGIYRGIFYVSGAESVDRSLRTHGVDYFPEEELSYLEANRCIDEYAVARPSIVISHECPERVISQLHSHHSRGSFTARLLEELMRIHQPTLWFFGHHHKYRRIPMEGTIFTCLGELQYTDITL